MERVGGGQDQPSEPAPHPAEVAEARQRELLSTHKDGYHLQVATGKLGSMSPFWRNLHDMDGWMLPACSNPIRNPSAPVTDTYIFGQRFYVWPPIGELGRFW